MDKQDTHEIYYYAIIALIVTVLFVGHRALNKPVHRDTFVPPAYTVLGEDTLWYSQTPDTAYRQGWDTTGLMLEGEFLDDTIGQPPANR